MNEIFADSHIKSTFEALVDAIIPNTPCLARELGAVQFLGARSLHIEKYVIYILNHLSALNQGMPLAEATAQMLDQAAEELIFGFGIEDPIDYCRFSTAGAFATLSPNDRFQAINLLEQFQVIPPNLPVPFRDNPSIVLGVIVTIIRITLMGYYSECSGYGSTGLEAPAKRKLHEFPISWRQVGYPGPSEGYHALRGFY